MGVIDNMGGKLSIPPLPCADLEGIHESLEVMSLHVRSPRGSGILNVPSSSSAGTIIGVSEKLVSTPSCDHTGTQN